MHTESLFLGGSYSGLTGKCKDCGPITVFLKKICIGISSFVNVAGTLIGTESLLHFLGLGSLEN